ncbi:MAG: hypothetical protein JWO37_4030 [Acidimicrobiales bacterium]|jgi:hypothetical protein|nr:hypothetical protein [Acidimicrobiales bacterium]
MTLNLLGLDAATYQPHPLHASERTWTETNCYVDLWIELLHALGLEPLAGCAFTLSADFEGDQWSFIKFPLEDLRALYGLDVAEIAVWRPVIDHVAEHLSAGRLLTVEVDSWFLPDTRGVSYRIKHVKSSIVPQLLDRAGKRLGYFHNAGYFELGGDDFDGVFATPALPPYVELVKVDQVERDQQTLVERAIGLTRAHLARRPVENPVVRMGERMEVDLEWLVDRDLEDFHDYAFVTVRQCGSTAELAASFVDWLDEHDGGGLGPVAERFRAMAGTAKALQFGLARRARGRGYDAKEPVRQMAADLEAAMAGLVVRYGD